MPSSTSDGGGVDEAGNPPKAARDQLLAGERGSVVDQAVASGGSDHGVGAGQEAAGGKSSEDAHSQRQQHHPNQQQEGGIISRVKGMQDRAGRTQVTAGEAHTR